MYIGNEEVRTGNTKIMTPPHDHKHVVGKYHIGDTSHAKQAVKAALEAKGNWSSMPWEQRVSIFLKAAELIAGPYRAKINAATMIAQSKTVHQAEIDAACESIDFLRFNAEYVSQIYDEQPSSYDGVWNKIEYRPLEGFVYAITPFNFTAIALNLPACMAMLGNTVVWKPSDHQIFSAQVIMEVFKAGWFTRWCDKYDLWRC